YSTEGFFGRGIFDVLWRKGRGSTAFFEFFDGGIVVLQVLRRYSIEESWV
uniref:Uncharacterized protein n=1 Tax=Cucumis melo TaxID=3656 RepID=A0A9I9EMI1_CUCME